MLIKFLSTLSLVFFKKRLLLLLFSFALSVFGNKMIVTGTQISNNIVAQTLESIQFPPINKILF